MTFPAKFGPVLVRGDTRGDTSDSALKCATVQCMRWLAVNIFRIHVSHLVDFYSECYAACEQTREHTSAYLEPMFTVSVSQVGV